MLRSRVTTPTPQRCLAAADQLLRGAGPLGAQAVDAGWWPRACACLIRLALECGVDGYWRRVRPTAAELRRLHTEVNALLARLDRTDTAPAGDGTD